MAKATRTAKTAPKAPKKKPMSRNTPKAVPRAPKQAPKKAAPKPAPKNKPMNRNTPKTVPIAPKQAPKKAPRKKFQVKVENVVAFVALGKKIPLTTLVNAMENAEYEPEQFPGLVYRTKEPRAAALIFSSGKIVCTGAKNIEKANIAMGKVVDRIRKAGIPMPRKYDVKIENIVASSRIDTKLNLEEVTLSLENAEYEPEQFPGLVYRIPEPRVAFLLFSSGKIICTGAQRIEDIHTALQKLRDKLESIGIKAEPAYD